MRQQIVYVALALLVFCILALSGGEIYAQVAKGVAPKGSEAGYSTLATILLAILIVLTELVRKLGWIPSPYESQLAEMHRLWLETKPYDKVNALHAGWTTEKVPEKIVDIHASVEDLEELHRTGRGVIPVWYCRCAQKGEDPCFGKVLEAMEKLKESDVAVTLDNVKIATLLETVLTKCKELRRGQDEVNASIQALSDSMME